MARRTIKELEAIIASQEVMLNQERGRTLKASAQVMGIERDLKELQEQYRKALDHSTRLLKAIQRSRRAERELVNVCQEVDCLPDSDGKSPFMPREWSTLFDVAAGRAREAMSPPAEPQ